MPMPPNRRTRIRLPADPLEKIPIEARSYVKGFREYDHATVSIRNFALPLSICRPIIGFLDAADYASLDARQHLAQALSSQRFDDLDERMQIEGIFLENFLQTRPEIDLSVWDDELPLTNQLEEFFDRFIEASMKPAFTLAANLMMA